MRESEELELAEMIISANKGVKEDQCSLATSYAEGSYGLKQDMKKAIILMRSMKKYHRLKNSKFIRRQI